MKSDLYPTSEATSDDTVITLEPEKKDKSVAEGAKTFDVNLAKYLSDETLRDLGTRFTDYANQDKNARNEHIERYAEGLRKTGLAKDAYQGAAFAGGSDIIYPLLSEAAIDFQSATIDELFPPKGPAKIWAQMEASADDLRKASRKADFLNRQLILQVPDYRAELERLLSQLPLAGNAYRFFWWDARAKKPAVRFVPVDKVLIPFQATSFYRASRITMVDEVSYYEFKARQRAGIYLKDAVTPREDDQPLNIFGSEAASESDDIEGKTETPGGKEGYRTVLVIFADLDLDEDPLYPEDLGSAPYILEVDAEHSKVLNLRRNWDKEDKQCNRLHYLVEWGLFPWRGAYSLGLTHLLSSMSSHLSGLLRVILDNAMLANMPTFLHKILPGMEGQTIVVNPGQGTGVDTKGAMNIRDAVMEFPFKPLDPLVLDLFQYLDKLSRGILQSSLDSIGQDNSTVPVGTQMSRIEQGLKTFKAVFGRLHESVRRELDILCRLYSLHMDTIYKKDNKGEIEYDSEGEKTIYLEAKDFADTADLAPVSDPAIFSEVQRMSRVQFLLGIIQQVPGVLDPRATVQSILENLDFPNIEKMLPGVGGESNDNPVTENTKMALGQAANALPDQDHIAHIATHLRFASNASLGASQIFQQDMLPFLVQHIKQHVLFYYAKLSLDAVNKEFGSDVTKLNQRNPAIANKIAKITAEVHPEVEQQMYRELLPVVEEMAKLQMQLQSMIPKPPEDPAVMITRVEAQGKVLENNTKERALDLKEQEIQQTNVLKNRELDIKAGDLEVKAQEKGINGLKTLKETMYDHNESQQGNAVPQGSPGGSYNDLGGE